MTYMERAPTIDGMPQSNIPTTQSCREPVVLVIEDDLHLTDAFRIVCVCLNLAVQRLPSHADLAAALRTHRPMAVVAEIDAAGRDGCNVLMIVAAFDRSLPVLLLTGSDPALLGAVDAVEEIWQLTAVTTAPELGGMDEMVEFLSHAGREGSCLQLLRV
jgi:DNA-binding NtrC family response regulator